MRQGFRVIDSDTHVNPSMDVLLRYADTPAARPHGRSRAVPQEGEGLARPR